MCFSSLCHLRFLLHVNLLYANCKFLIVFTFVAHNTKHNRTQLHVTSQVSPLLKREDVDSLQDPRMPEIAPREDFLDFMRVATLCVQENSCDRPEMQEVVHRLTRIGVTSP